jgi:5,10-methylenetetrahydromethanopterin reductase
MRISIVDLTSRTPAEATEGALAAEREGLDTYWLAGGWRDPLLLCALAGQQARTIDFGSSIVSVYGIHPTVLAEQALTVNAALDGRFTLGVGVSHKKMVEGRLGQSFDRPVRQLREFLTILDALLTTGAVDVQGELLSAHTELRIEGVARPDVVVGALSEQSLRVSGALSDGISTTWVDPGQLESHTIPIVSAAAAEAGRPAPRIIAAMPICVTTDPDVRERAAAEFAVYKTRYTAYAATFARSGVSGPEDVVVIGDEETVRKELLRYRDVGVHEFVANLFGTLEEKARTHAFLQDVAASA